MSDASWWAAKLGGQMPPQSSYPPAARPTYLPQQPEQPRTRAQSAKQTDRCPDCDSENYFRPTPTIQQHCYDCGYPLVQSGTGAATVKAEGKTRPARQVKTDGYNPQMIVGRVE